MDLTISRRLNAAGYYSAFVGKWHNLGRNADRLVPDWTAIPEWNRTSTQRHVYQKVSVSSGSYFLSDNSLLVASLRPTG